MKRCRTGKFRYTTELDAKIRAVKIEGYAARHPSGDDWEPQRVYYCNMCGGYHTTTQEQRTERV
jgi:hypothetical protein